MPATTQRQKIEAIEFWGVCVSHAFMSLGGGEGGGEGSVADR
jgi:hypothetical protein